MSNHSGSYLANKIVREVLALGLLESASNDQKDALAKKLWSLCWEYDCNWGEIVDEYISEQLNVCRDCGNRGGKRDEHGYCVRADGKGCLG